MRKNKAIRELQRLAEQAQELLAQYTDQKQVGLDLSGMPTDTVLFFRLSFTPGGKVYTYVALKCENGFWYTSTRTSYQNVFTDAEFEIWLARRRVHEVWIATEWERIDV